MKKNWRQMLLTSLASPWKWLADIWGYITILIFLLDFFYQQHIRVQSTGVAIIYTAILVIYSSNKEYSRWKKNKFISRYHGEFFIVLWSLLFFFFIITAGLFPQKFTIDPTFYTTYITILGIFAITLNSKNLKKRKKVKRK